MTTSKINTADKLHKLPPPGDEYKDAKGKVKLATLEPTWEVLAKGKSLGYRKSKNACKWVAKLATKTRKTAVIGDGSLRYEGRKAVFGAMTYEEAREAALEWCDSLDGGSSGSYSLSQCITDYEEYLRIEKTPESGRQARRQLLKHLPSPMLKTPVRELTTKQLRAWRNSLIPDGLSREKTRQKKSTANRIWTNLRAAMNKAFNDGIVNSNLAWVRIKPFKSVDGKRELYLTPQQANALLSSSEGALHDLIRAGILTGARLGELEAAKAKDLDGGVLKLSGKTGSRDVFLSREAEAFFKKLASDKLPNAPLLLSPAGGHWKKNIHSRPFKAAAQKAKLPAETVYYSLRHFHISRALLSGINIQVIAENCGTSVKMIEKHYGKFMKADRRGMMDAVELG